MRGHWLSGTRKLNRHYQSGGRKVISNYDGSLIGTFFQNVIYYANLRTQKDFTDGGTTYTPGKYRIEFEFFPDNSVQLYFNECEINILGEYGGTYQNAVLKTFSAGVDFTPTQNITIPGYFISTSFISYPLQNNKIAFEFTIPNGWTYRTNTDGIFITTGINSASPFIYSDSPISNNRISIPFNCKVIKL